MLTFRFLSRSRPALSGSLLLLIIGVISVSAADVAFVPGVEGDGPSNEAGVSANGRFTVFASDAANLVPHDANGLQDIFLHDRQTGDTVRVSVTPGGGDADGYSEHPAISDDGRFIAFQSVATNLVQFDNNMESDAFVYDVETAEISRVSVASDGSQAAGASYEPDISADGRFVVFTSTAINLDAADDNSYPDVFIRNRQTGQTSLVSFDRTGGQSAGFSGRPSVSADGRLVAFSSGSAELVAGDENDYEDIFVRDRQANKTKRVSVNSDGDEVFADSYDPALSADGGVVAFWSYSSGLTDDDTDGYANVFVHELQTGETSLASHGLAGAANGDSSAPRLSEDGRIVVFQSDATNLTADADDNHAADVYLHDRASGQTALLSAGSSGPGDDESSHPALSPDGRFVVFQSRAANLVAGDGNSASDIFLRDATTGVIKRVSIADNEPEPVESTAYLSVMLR